MVGPVIRKKRLAFYLIGWTTSFLWFKAKSNSELQAIGQEGFEVCYYSMSQTTEKLWHR